MNARPFIHVCLALGMAVLAWPQEELRQRLNFNREWTFCLGDHPGAEAPGFADPAFAPCHLPHSFSLPYFLSDKFYTGYGWYRKRFDLPPGWIGKRISLEFEGVFQDAEIFLNGQRVAHHLGGYTGFPVDLTAAAVPGENVLAVRVNNLWNPRLAPRAGEHVFSGGIYRDVWLVATAPLHVAWYGTGITTPSVSPQAATVQVQTELRNDGPSPLTCTLETRLIDPAGGLVATLVSRHAVPANGSAMAEQASPPIADPKLWHPDHPYLYHALSTVSIEQVPVDTYETTFGIRSLRWTATEGFFLNGERHYIIGANVHQDHAGWGDAVANAGFERDVRLVKEAGFDFIRGSHYPHDPAFADACDRQGMMLWSENCFWGSGGFKSDGDFASSSAYPVKPDDEPEFRESVRNSLRDMIRINRNHPAIVAWSMGNEVFFSEKSTLPTVRGFLSELVAYTHELDPTRPAAIGGCQRGDIDKLGDLAGYNGDGARLFLDPGVPSLVSEYGSTIADRPGSYAPGWGDLQQERFPWRSGQVLWCAFDHGSHAGRFGHMGMLDYFRLPKRQWYWYRNAYRHIPPPAWPQAGTPAGLRLSADRTALAAVDGTDDAQVIATVVDAAGQPISNCPTVTLRVISGPGEFPTGASITFAPDSDIAIRDGQAAIEFRSYYAGSSVIEASAPGLQPARITITAAGGPAFVPGVTQAPRERPYVRFTGKHATAEASAILGLENPTRASSEAPGHAARLGNDGDAATCWQAQEPGPGAWWQVDLERLVAISDLSLTFPGADGYRYHVDVSNDGVAWTPIVDAAQGTGIDRTRRHAVSPAVGGRFLRVTFTGQSAALSEITVRGKRLGD